MTACGYLTSVLTMVLTDLVGYLCEHGREGQSTRTEWLWRSEAGDGATCAHCCAGYPLHVLYLMFSSPMSDLGSQTGLALQARKLAVCPGTRQTRHVNWLSRR